MKTWLRGMVTVSALLLLAAPLFAAGAPEQASVPGFLSQFEEALQEEGLSEVEARAVAEAAQEYDWSQGRRADPALIAEALAEAEEDGTELGPNEQAQLARELAENAARLEEEGYTEGEVAQATLQAVEQLRRQIREWHDGDQEEPLGEVVRNRVSEVARETAQHRETSSGDDAAGSRGPGEGSESAQDERPSGADAAADTPAGGAGKR